MPSVTSSLPRQWQLEEGDVEKEEESLGRGGRAACKMKDISLSVRVSLAGMTSWNTHADIKQSLWRRRGNSSCQSRAQQDYRLQTEQTTAKVWALPRALVQKIKASRRRDRQRRKYTPPSASPASACRWRASTVKGGHSSAQDRLSALKCPGQCSQEQFCTAIWTLSHRPPTWQRYLNHLIHNRIIFYTLELSLENCIFCLVPL